MVASDLIRVGHLLGPHGIQGAVKLYVLGRPEQLRNLKRLYVEDVGWLRLSRFEQHGAGVVLSLGGVESREAAAELRGKRVYAHDQELPPLPDGEYYYHELRSLPVRRHDGQPLGEVSDVLDMGHQDLLVVQTLSGGRGLVPLQAPYVQVLRGRAIVLTEDAPAGLLDAEEPAHPHA